MRNFSTNSIKLPGGQAALCGALFLLILGSSPSHAVGLPCNSVPGNLITNCGFETGTFSSWTLSGNDVPGSQGVLYGVEGVDPLDGISPNHGTSQAYIADLQSNATTLAQTLTTNAGKAYQITFDLAQDTLATALYPNGISVLFDGVTLYSASNIPVEGYTQYTFYGLASTASTAFSLKLGNSLGEFLLDDVAVSLAPEPSTLFLLMSSGFLTLGIMRRKFAK